MEKYSNKQYYEDLKSGSDRQFDLIETTISHLFRFPHPALNDLSYGAAFCKELLKRKLLTSEHQLIIEVGGGLGDFAHDMLVQLYREGIQIPYIILDISQQLQEKQQSVLSKFQNVHFHLIDAQEMPFKDAEVEGIIISNEVIADFDAIELTKQEWEVSDNVDVKFLREYISSPKEKALVNTGAINFIKEIYRVLAPGGNAIITEHGLQEDARVTVTGRPTSLETSHTEFSINWKHLTLIAENLGFTYETIPLIDFLPFDKDLPVTNLNDARALNNVDPIWPIAAIPTNLLYQSFGDVDLRSAAGLRLPKIGEEGFPDDNTLPFHQSFQTLILKK